MTMSRAFALVAAALMAAPAMAETADGQSLQQQIDSLQHQLNDLKAQSQKQAAAPASAAEAAKSLFANTAIKLTFGGFIENTVIDRSRFQGTDVNSNWNLASHGFGGGGMPLPNSPDYHTGEWRDTARQTRLSLLAQGQEDYSALAAFYEMDFLGGGSGTSANMNESNSYFPRIRHLYATYDDIRDGWHVLAGQTWSMLTLDRAGITPRQELIPLTIDAQYVPGFTWTRNPQVRVVKDFGQKLWLGLSVESPAAIVNNASLPASSLSGYTGSYAYGSVDYNSAAGSNMPATLTLDQAPDIIAKIAADPGFGHYELSGVVRFFNDRILAAAGGQAADKMSVGGGIGAAAVVPVVPGLVDLQLSGMVGRGIGRYGAAQLADVTVDGASGRLTPIPEVQALLGIVAHPSDRLDLFAYGGFEAEEATKAQVINGIHFGYGNSGTVSQATCEVEGAGTTACNAQAQAVKQLTAGAWYSAYKGQFGVLKLGLTDSYTWTKPFGLESVNENIVMASVRYYPF